MNRTAIALLGALALNGQAPNPAANSNMAWQQQQMRMQSMQMNQMMQQMQMQIQHQHQMQLMMRQQQQMNLQQQQGLVRSQALKRAEQELGARGFKGAYGLVDKPAKVAWRAYDLDRETLPSFDGTHLVVAIRGKAVRSVDLATGKTRWEMPVEDHLEVPPMLMGDRVLYATAAWELVLLDSDTGRCAHRIKMDEWSNFILGAKADHPKVLFPAFEGGRLLLATFGKGPSGKAEGRLHAYDPASGRAVWEVPVAGGADIPPVVDSDRVMVGGEGQVSAFALQDGKALWTSSIGSKDRLVSGQTVEGRFLVGAGHSLVALDAATGRKLWETAAMPGPLLLGEGGRIVLTENRAAFGGTKAWIVALDAATGARLWERKLVSSQMPWLQEGRIFCNAEEDLLALDPATGKPIWTFKLPRAPRYPLLPMGDLLLAANEFEGQTFIRALDTANGQARWTYTLDGQAGTGMMIPIEQGLLLPLPGGQLDLIQ